MREHKLGPARFAATPGIAREYREPLFVGAHASSCLENTASLHRSSTDDTEENMCVHVDELRGVRAGDGDRRGGVTSRARALQVESVAQSQHRAIGLVLKKK